MVSPNQMLSASQRGQTGRCHIRSFHGKITKNINLIIIGYFIIPLFDKGCIHFLYIAERPLRMPYGTDAGD